MEVIIYTWQKSHACIPIYHLHIIFHSNEVGKTACADVLRSRARHHFVRKLLWSVCSLFALFSIVVSSLLSKPVLLCAACICAHTSRAEKIKIINKIVCTVIENWSMHNNRLNDDNRFNFCPILSEPQWSNAVHTAQLVCYDPCSVHTQPKPERSIIY